MMLQGTLPSAIVCIATCGRPENLANTLESWRHGDHVPTEVRVADSSSDGCTRAVCARPWDPLPVRYIAAPIRSAAMQRNLAAEGCDTDIIVFCDDDILLPEHALSTLLAEFANDRDGKIGAIAGTIEGMRHRVPGRWLRWYYRLQAGYAHPHYGGRFFGPAINVLPTDEADDPILYRSEWLNAGLTAYRACQFAANRFPEFTGYSFQEDVNVSYRVGRTHELYFHRGVRYIHVNAPSRDKTDGRQLGTMQMVNRWQNATELLSLTGYRRTCKFLLSLVFDAVYLVRSRPDGWKGQLAGSVGAFVSLGVRGKNPCALRAGIPT